MADFSACSDSKSNDGMLEYKTGRSAFFKCSENNEHAYPPKNTSFLFDGKLIINLGSNVSLINYYKAAYGVDIKNPDQPLFESEVTNHDGKTSVIYLVPELCLLSGIDDSCIADRDFMTELAKQTKFVPKGINLVLNKIVLLKLKNVSNFSKKNQRKLEQ